MTTEPTSTYEIEMKRKTERFALLCWEIFTQNESGKELMELLEELYIVKNPVAAPHHKQVYGDFYVGIREGQNDLIRQMHNLAVNFKRNEEK